MLVFLVYFCILREENDLDELLFGRTLYDWIDGLEKSHLIQGIKYARLVRRNWKTGAGLKLWNACFDLSKGRGVNKDHCSQCSIVKRV